MRNILILFCQFFLFNNVIANVVPNSLFSDHMVLQEGVPVPIWGTADKDEKVTVIFNDQRVSTITGEDGKWFIKLSSFPYILKPSSMVITGKDTVIIKDIMVGEVWLCSGQSNMERQLGQRPPQPLIYHWEEERDAAKYPLIREYYVPLKYAKQKVDDVNSKWTVCSPKTVSDFSAVGYFFARDLFKQLKVPVGIIFSAYGGTPAEDWTSKIALESNPKLRELVKNYNSVISEHWHPSGELISGLYNGMIYPLIPYSIKGVVWYQGEQNNFRPKQYRTILANMIKNWRTDFKQGEFPFLIVQIAPYKEMSPELRESQFWVTQTTKNTALIVTTDCGDANNIHPSHKQPVGYRLSLAARALAYNENIEYSGPVFDSYKIKNNKIILSFKHVGKGLSTKYNAPLKGFTIASDDKKFISATAVIKRNHIVVYGDNIQKPTAARYGWSNVPDGNLYNSQMLPASPFRTDTAYFK